MTMLLIALAIALGIFVLGVGLAFLLARLSDGYDNRGT